MALFGRKRDESSADPSTVTVTAEQAYRCSLCLEEIPLGTSMFRCGCAQMFHGECSPGVFNCPKCRSPIRAPMPELGRREPMESPATSGRLKRGPAPSSRSFDEALDSARKAWNNDNEK